MLLFFLTSVSFRYLRFGDFLKFFSIKLSSPISFTASCSICKSWIETSHCIPIASIIYNFFRTICAFAYFYTYLLISFNYFHFLQSNIWDYLFCTYLVVIVCYDKHRHRVDIYLIVTQNAYVSIARFLVTPHSELFIHYNKWNSFHLLSCLLVVCWW